MSNKAITVYAEAYKRQQLEAQPRTTKQSSAKDTQVSTRVSDSARTNSRGNLRAHVGKKSRAHSRISPRDFPTRDEIQEFTFRMRDEVKVKVQAEVPHLWQKELQEIARELDVKKLELYRFIIGEFLCKVKRKGDT